MTQYTQPKPRSVRRLIALIAGAVFLLAGGTAAGYFLVPRLLPAEHTHNNLYTCPMHPQVVQEGPGTCPICSMELVPLKQKGGDSAHEHDEKMVHVTPRNRVMAGVSTVKIDYAMPMDDIHAAAVAEYSEEAKRVVSARYGGRIEKLFVNKTGQSVQKGQPLMEIYSPELTAAQKEYLIAVDAKRIRSDNNENFLTAARRKLLLLGMADAQITALEQRGEIAYTVTVFSPASGVVTSRAVVEGAYINEGSLLLEIIDLSTVWVVANVYESDLPRLRTGMAMDVTGSALGSTVLHGKVDYIYPTVDPQTRTIKVRAVLAARGVLKPGMYLSATVHVPGASSLVVPVNAVVRTGLRDIVYVEVEKNMFEPREVHIGTRANGLYQITGGELKAGDYVVAEGGYLLDSERQLSSTGAADPHAGHSAGGGK